jgi:hypothetical protein
VDLNPGRSSGRENVLKPAVTSVPAPAGLNDRAWDFPAISVVVAKRLLAQGTDIDADT